jgi:D-alanyl-lipoteichoic acid acyltransferase DltB (MBOAT superfamily)
VFLISGLWHGASWMFIIWGGIHGFYSLYERATEKYRNRLWKALKLDGTKLQWFIQWSITMGVVLFSWVFFRAESLEDALIVLNKVNDSSTFEFDNIIFGLARTFIGRVRFFAIVLAICSLELLQMIEEFRNKDFWIDKENLVLSYIILWVILIFGSFGLEEFIYFQF